MWAGRPGLSPASGRSTCRPTPLGRGKYGPLWTPQISAGMRPPSLAGPHGGDKGSWLSWSLPCGPHFVSVAQMRKSRLREGPEGEGWSAPMTTPPDPRMSCAGAGLGVGTFLGPDEGLFFPGSPAGANWWFPAPPPGVQAAGCSPRSSASNLLFALFSLPGCPPPSCTPPPRSLMISAASCPPAPGS